MVARKGHRYSAQTLRIRDQARRAIGRKRPGCRTASRLRAGFQSKRREFSSEMNAKPQQRAICTIIAKNYLAQARVLCASFLRHHPGGKCYVLIVDAIDGYFDPEDEPFEVVRLSDLAIANVGSFCFKYTVLELSTAVKPFLLRHLLAKHGIERILYLDPDILVTSSLDELFAQLGE